MAHMQATRIESEPPLPLVETPSEPIVEISATLTRAQAFLSGCGIALMVREGASLVCRASNGAAAPEIGSRMPVEQTFLGLCVTLKKPQSCEDADSDIRVENATYGRLKPKSIVAVPVRAGQDVIAVLAGFSSAPNAFSNTQVAILRTVADSISRPVQQLPMSPEPPAQPAPKMESWASSSQERAVKPEPQPVAAAPAPPPPPKPPEVAPTLTAEPTAPAPSFAKPQEELLTLADNFVPARRVPEPPRVSAPAPRVMTFPVPRSFDIPRAQPRRFSPAWLRITGITAACLLCALATAGWYTSRVPESPRVYFAAVPRPMITPAPPPTPVIAPAPEVAAAPVAARPSSPEPKEHAAVATHAEPQASKVALAEPAPIEAVALKPLPHREPASAAAEAPTLALNAAPGLPALVAPHAEAPKIHQSVAVPARLEYRVSPDYPSAALKRRVSGQVLLSLHIRKDGSVAEVKVVSGDSLFRDSAVAAAKHFHYAPATLDGQLVEASAQVLLKFELPAR